MARTSRKGKKAWRRNISTTDVEAAIEENTRNERQGTDVGVLLDSQLFFIDKAKACPPAPAATKPSDKRKEKVLRSQAIIDASQQARPVTRPVLGKKQQHRQSPAIRRTDLASKKGSHGGRPTELYDMWETKDIDQEQPEDFDAVAKAVAAKQTTPFGPHRPAKRRKAQPVQQIQAVEIDEPGCSYNPDRDQHEATVAHAVAVEVQKSIDAEMHAKPLPRHIEWQPETDPLLEYQVDEDYGDMEVEQGGAYGLQGGPVQRRQPGKKPKSTRNKEARMKVQEAEMAAKQRLKQQRRELQNLDAIGQEVSEAEQERERRQQRRERMKAEKALSGPPRLGKVKFQEAAVQVLLTTEITGSLRKLKPAAMLARERFNSLQKRGIIEPRLRAIKKQKRKRIEYMHGQRGEKNREAHKDLEAQRKAGRT